MLGLFAMDRLCTNQFVNHFSGKILTRKEAMSKNQHYQRKLFSNMKKSEFPEMGISADHFPLS